MTKIYVKGAIISDNLQRIYDWIGIEATSPSKVIKGLTDSKDVEVLINSGGGDVFAGSEIYTALREHKGNVTVKITGIAASAASVIAMAADHILISPTAQMMIHNVSTTVSGDYRNFEHAAEVMKSANEAIANAYMHKTNKSLDELTALMDKETWFNAEKAVQAGFADEVMFSEQLALTASNNTLLSQEVINRIQSLIENEESQEKNAEKAKYQAQLNLLKIGGKLS